LIIDLLLLLLGGGEGGGLLTPNFYSFPSNSFTIVLNFHGKFYF
jgi:hypothetical protein